MECLLQLVLVCALDTTLVSNVHDMSVKKLLLSKSLPVPDIGVANLSSEMQLYTPEGLWGAVAAFIARLRGRLFH